MAVFLYREGRSIRANHCGEVYTISGDGLVDGNASPKSPESYLAFARSISV